MKGLREKVAVVTGAGSGIGRVLAVQLCQEGSILALADEDEEALELPGELLEGPGRRRLFGLDVSLRDQVYAFAADVVEEFGRVDAVINNAGVSSSGFVEELTLKRWNGR